MSSRCNLLARTWTSVVMSFWMALVQWLQWLLLVFYPKTLGGGGHLWMILCHSINAGWVVWTLRGSGDTQTLPAIIKFQWGHWNITLAPSRSPAHKSHLVKLFTARKWSLGQGNIFAPVCHSVHRGGVPGQVPLWDQPPPRDQVHHPSGTRYTPPVPGTPAPPDQVPPWNRYPPDQVHPPGAVHAGRYGQQAGGKHPTGIHSCSTFNLLR